MPKARGAPSIRGLVEALLPAAALVTSLTACATSHPFHRHYEAGELRRAQRVFDRDSSLHADPRAVFRAGLVYADPESPVFDPRRARRQVRALEEMDAPTDYVHAARAVLELGERVDSLRSRLGELRHRNVLLRTRLEVLRETFSEMLTAEFARSDSLRSVADSLRSRLRRTSRELDDLKEKLARMREVDLQDQDGG